MARRVLVKIKRVGKGRYSGQFDCRRGDVILLPRGEALRILMDFPDEFVKMPADAKVDVHAQNVMSPADLDDEVLVEAL